MISAKVGGEQMSKGEEDVGRGVWIVIRRGIGVYYRVWSCALCFWLSMVFLITVVGAQWVIGAYICNRELGGGICTSGGRWVG